MKRKASDLLRQKMAEQTTGLNGQVQENDKVSYNVTDGQKGPTATNVNVI